MPLPKPSLDNRSFDQLVSECRGLLARAAPQWTDYNASDPGITLLELGAWLGEQNIFRLDQLTDEARRDFVRLVGVEPRPPGVAGTVVAVVIPGGDAIELPARIQLGQGDDALFETTSGLFVSPAQLVRIGVGAEADRQAFDPRATQDAFDVFGAKPRPGAAIHLGFDRAVGTAGATLSLHVWTERWLDDDAQRRALLAEQAHWNALCGSATTPPHDWRLHYRVRTVWEYLSAAGDWRPLGNVVDETRSLSLSGFVRFSAPADPGTSGPGSLCWLRCRIVGGRFECPPRLVRLAFNAVACEHALGQDAGQIAVSRGHAGALFALGSAPVVAGSLRLRVTNESGVEQAGWREVADWDRSGAHDRHYRLDPERGEIEFGDGLRGAILPAGHAVAAAYRRGGGAGGNLGRGTLSRLPPNQANLQRAPALAGLGSALEVRQPFAARGGSERETIALAQARAFDRASEVDKAVTLDDFERIALATPGVPVARARAVANLDPLLPCYAAPGVVTLVVIPPCPRPSPLPSRAMLDAVLRYLAPRRLVASEIHAVAPRYRKVGVQATLHLDCGVSATQVLRTARERLNTYLDPLDGGIDGQGWPFGGAVYRSETLALLAGTPGVERVTSLGFVVTAAAGQRPRCDNVLLCPDELVRPGPHRLTTTSEVGRILNRSEPHECESR